MAKKILVVFGATGKQGGSVVRSMLGDATLKAEWAVKAVTRDVSKPAAQSLKELGAELIAADMDDPPTLDSALKGAYAVFGVTNYWETMDPARETAQGKAVADAAKSAGVEHFIFSSLYNVTELSGGVLKNVQHFDSKAAVTDHIKKIDLPHTIFMPGLFIDALPGGSFRQSPPNNAWTFMLPVPDNTPMPAFLPQEDTGKFVKAILSNRDKVLGKEILGASEYITPAEIVSQFKEKFPKAGVDAMFVQMSSETFKQVLGQMGLPAFGAEELLENMRLMAEFGYYGGKGLGESHEILTDSLVTWKSYMGQAPAFAGLL